MNANLERTTRMRLRRRNVSDDSAFRRGRPRSLGVATAAIGALLIASPATALAAGDQTTTSWPITEPIYNTCNDEMVLINGTWTETVRQRFDNGRLRYESNAFLTKVTAAATETGRAYTVRKTASYRLDNDDIKGVSRTTQLETLLVSPKTRTSGKNETLRVVAYKDQTVNTRTGESIGTPR